MKIYLSAGVTFTHDPALIKEIIDWLKSRGHSVLDEHIAYENHREAFSKITGISLEGKSKDEIDNIIRNQDLFWTEEADVFIGLFLKSSFGVGVEFEHLRFLTELQLTHQLRSYIPDKIAPMLCIFPKWEQSAMIHGIDPGESLYIYKRYVSDQREALKVIQDFMEKIEKGGENNG